MTDRPPIGTPCNGCGLCCHTHVCLTGSKVLGLVDTLGQRAPGPCHALVKSDDAGWRCGLVETPTKWINNGLGVTRLRQAVKLLIGVGIGRDVFGVGEQK